MPSSIHLIAREWSSLRVPEDKDFYKRIVAAVRGAPSLVLVGGATGKSSAAHIFFGHIEKYHKYLHGLVGRIEERDLSALTNADIERLARTSSSER